MPFDHLAGFNGPSLSLAHNLYRPYQMTECREDN